jgi:hypothetical protein
VSALTIFTVPKPFEGDAEVAQRNALGSWSRLRPKPQIVLFGDARGVAEAARDHHAELVKDVERTRYGTPLLHSVFRSAHVITENERLCYANADIVFLEDLPATVKRIAAPSFLLTGRRRELPSQPISFEPGWEQELRERARRAPAMHPFGSDYFVFARLGPYTSLPPFTVGRPAWDNWMIFRARTLGLPIYDASRCVTAIHHAHGHGHIPELRGPEWASPETDANRAVAAREIGGDEIFHLRDATHVVTPSRIRPVSPPLRAWRRWRNRRAYHRARLAEHSGPVLPAPDD